MKCPECGKWNQAAMPHCFYCGAELDGARDFSSGSSLPWQNELSSSEKPKEYMRVDDSGSIESMPDPRDALADEMAELKKRKMQGEIQQRRLRENAARRGVAPSGRTVRTTTNRSTFFSASDDPDTTLRPVDPQLIDDAGVDPAAQPVYTGKYKPSSVRAKKPVNPYAGGATHRTTYINDPEAEQVYDGYHDISEYMPYDDRHAGRDRGYTSQYTAQWMPRRLRMRRVMRALLVIAALLILCWVGYAVVLPLIREAKPQEAPKAEVTATIREDLAAHTVTIPGNDGERITIRELRTSAIVTGGVATFDILDHIWYDDFDDYLKETMPITLTPFVMTESGKQKPLEPIHYDIDIPLSPIQLITPDSNYEVVSTPMYNIVVNVREGSTLHINGEDYSDLVNTEGGRVSYNATVQPTGENKYEIIVRSQYCRENSLTVTLYREKQDIPLDLASDIGTRSTSRSMLVRATTLPGATVNVLSPHTDLNITNTGVDGSFTFYAVFDHIGTNTMVVTADYPGKQTTRVEYNIYYVPSIDDYSRKAWDVARDYNDLLSNMETRKRTTQIYVCKGTITTIETTKPQRAFMNCGTEDEPVMIYVENQSRTTWEEGTYYRLYADAYGMYSSRPWLIARYTYTN